MRNCRKCWSEDFETHLYQFSNFQVYPTLLYSKMLKQPHKIEKLLHYADYYFIIKVQVSPFLMIPASSIKTELFWKFWWNFKRQKQEHKSIHSSYVYLVLSCILIYHEEEHINYYYVVYVKCTYQILYYILCISAKFSAMKVKQNFHAKFSLISFGFVNVESLCDIVSIVKAIFRSIYE